MAGIWKQTLQTRLLVTYHTDFSSTGCVARSRIARSLGMFFYLSTILSKDIAVQDTPCYLQSVSFPYHFYIKSACVSVVGRLLLDLSLSFILETAAFGII